MNPSHFFIREMSESSHTKNAPAGMFAIRIPSGMEAKRIKEKQFIEEVFRQSPVLLSSGFYCVLMALVVL